MNNKIETKSKNTNAQIIAANPKQSIWVSANAGTGKTTVLINRILHLLVNGTLPHKILCLTFTKTAAAEVAIRLRKRLGEWAIMEEKELKKALKKLLGTDDLNEEITTARTLFASILETPEGLRIRTVHSFAESLLGRFPVEAKITPHFSVIDERRATEILTEARNQIIAQNQHHNIQLSDALSYLACEVYPDQLERLIRELYKERSRLRHLMNNPDGLKRMIANARNALGLTDEDSKESLIKAASLKLDENALQYAVKALKTGSKPNRDLAENIDTWLKMNPTQRTTQFIKTYAPLFITKDETVKKRLIIKEARENHPEAISILENEGNRILLVLEKLKAIAIAEASKSLFTFGIALIGAYEEIKTSRALLDYDDLIEKAEELLENDDGVSWVHYKLDGGIDHILVDEAQDTSPSQWNIISRLAGDFFSGLGARDHERPQNRTVFAVGDEKQSIYSFQGADPIRFGLMRKHFHDQETAIGRDLSTIDLEVSYRTTTAILDVVDAVFASSEALDGLTWNKKAVHHNSNRQGQSGLVELWETLTPDDVLDIRPWDYPFDKITAKSPITRLAEKIAGRIKEWLHNKTILKSEGRPITPGDIMILLPQRKPFAEAILRALKRHGIPVIGMDRLIVTNHLAVMDLIAAGRFSLLPNDDLNTAVVLKGPFIEFDDDILFTLAHGRLKSKTLWQTLIERRDEKPEFAHAYEILSGLLTRADFTPPFEFYSQLLNNEGRRNLLAHLGSEANEPVDEFLALALDFERDHEPSLEGFLYWLERGKAEVKREMEEGIDGVRVLTVHGAKGLESNIVFLPDTCKLPSPTNDPRIHWNDSENTDNFFLWAAKKELEEPLSKELHSVSRNKKIQEYRRLLYVAMTRARDQLYICGWEDKVGKQKGCWYDLLLPVLQERGKKISTDTGENMWRIETPQKIKKIKDNSPYKEPEPNKALPKWVFTPAPEEPLPIQPLAPSKPSEEDPPALSPIKDGNMNYFQRGILVHRLLQSLPDVPRKDREEKGYKFLKQPSLKLTEDARKDILNETLAIINHPDYTDLFGPGSLAEVPITGIIGSGKSRTVVSGQIDRLLVTKKTITVVDYKTNRPPPENENSVEKRYLHQMASYRDLIKSVYPDHLVQALLLWTVGPRIMLLTNKVLDDYAP